jgi:hypothetical protein
MEKALMLSKSFAAALLSCVFMTQGVASAQTAPAPKGDRILAIDVSGRQAELIDPVFVSQYFAGIQSIQLMLDWTDIEIAPGVYDAPYLKALNDYYSAFGIAINLTIRPVDAGHKNVPPDLLGVPFDDPRMIFRFFRVLDYVFSQLPTVTLTSLGIGNEVDEYLRYFPGELTAYKQFYDWSNYYAKQLRPGIKIGVSANLGALLSPRYSELAWLNQYSDVLMVLYYPMNVAWSAETGEISLFEVRAPSEVGPDVDRLSGLFPGIHMQFKEAGYPTCGVCGSSEELQRQFISAMFSAWDAHRDQIDLVTFFRYSDFSPDEIDHYADYYRSQSVQFRSFLGTLGLRTWPANGQFKPAFTQLAIEARTRGW